MGAGQSETPEESFWRWFQSNESALRTLDPVGNPENADKLLDRIQERLADVQEGLVCEIGTPGDDGRREFIVSADGNRELFPAVRRLVRAAPELEYWETIPFRPRQGIKHKVHLGTLSLDPDNIWFRAIPSGKKVDLYLFLKDFKLRSRDEVVRAGYILLDSALGELDVEQKLAGIKWQDLPLHPESEGFTPFYRLPETVDRMVSESLGDG
jgi:hypothetical protein